jgi:predicted nucleic acid-binding protein
MTHYLDSSVLVAALVEDEPRHEACLRLFRKKNAVTWVHALTETFATLTGGRLGLRASPATAALLINAMAPRLRLIELDAADTLAAINDAESVGVRGGAIYDYLHLFAARKVSATEIHTLNGRHFSALAGKSGPRIAIPSTDPSE